MPLDDEQSGVSQDPRLSRRGFGLASLAAGAAAAGAATAAETVVESDVSIPSPDGACDAAFFHPSDGKPRPGVVMITDVIGLRPVFRQMGKRLAGAGYSVVVPNVYYRSQKAPLITGPFDFSNPADREKLAAPRALLTPDNVTRDCSAWIDWLDGQKAVNAKAPVGFTGYCMGGAIVVRAAAARPDRVGAGGSFHGGGLTTDAPDSPHLLAPKIKAAMYFGVAANDDARQPESKTILRQAFAGHDATVEVYAANHGWCVPGSAAYDEPEAERAWAALLAMYGRALV
ncbi:MAG: dienelactone hydrolase family protein [Caulobacter sp.]|nr:dienelactone hydrolase family protein [Caulobacter sp.]